MLNQINKPYRNKPNNFSEVISQDVINIVIEKNQIQISKKAHDHLYELLNMKVRNNSILNFSRYNILKMQNINPVFLSYLNILEEKCSCISSLIQISRQQKKTKNLLSFEYLIKEIEFWLKNITHKLDACYENLRAQIQQNISPQTLNYYETQLRMKSNVQFCSVRIHNIFEIQTNTLYELSLYLWENEQLDYIGKGDLKNQELQFELDQVVKVNQNQEINLVIMLFGEGTLKVKQKELKQQFNRSQNFEVINDSLDFVAELVNTKQERKQIDIQRLQDKEMNFLDQPDSIKLPVKQYATITIKVLRSFYLISFYHPAIQREKPVGLSFAWQQQAQKLRFEIHKGIDLNGELLHEQDFEVENQIDDLVECRIERHKQLSQDGIHLKQDQQYILSIEQLNMACYYYSYKNEQPNIYFQTIEAQQNQFMKSHNKKGIFPKFKITV
ncbi:hypothetical protein pb186bvf_012719 [Paramecium bursaria]